MLSEVQLNDGWEGRKNTMTCKGMNVERRKCTEKKYSEQWEYRIRDNEVTCVMDEWEDKWSRYVEEFILFLSGVRYNTCWKTLSCITIFTILHNQENLPVLEYLKGTFDIRQADTFISTILLSKKLAAKASSLANDVLNWTQNKAAENRQSLYNKAALLWLLNTSLCLDLWISCLTWSQCDEEAKADLCKYFM